MDPLPPCPYAHKGSRKAHNLSVIVPDTAEHPATLFCDRCGITRSVALVPVPMDNLSAEEIDRLLVRRS